MSLDLMANLDPKGEGNNSMPETGGYAQAYGVTCREIRVIWLQLDCRNPNLQKVQLPTRRKDA